jgi:hypothetical protein
MTLCDCEHDEICYCGRFCPVCEKMQEIKELQEEIKKLESELE